MLRIRYGSADVGRAVAQQLYFNRFRQAFGERGQHLANAVGGVDNIRAGLALHVHYNRRLFISPGAKPGIFSALFHGCHVAKANRRAVLISDNQVAVLFRGLHLVVG